MSHSERQIDMKAFLSPTSVVDDSPRGHNWKMGLPKVPQLHPAQEEPGQTQWVSLPLTAVESLLGEFEEEDDETRVAFSFDEKENLRHKGKGANRRHHVSQSPLYQPEFSLNPKVLQHQQADFERRRVDDFNARAYRLETEEAMSFKAMRQLQEDMREMEVSDATMKLRSSMVENAVRETNVPKR